jgi:hypothetical protein
MQVRLVSLLALLGLGPPWMACASKPPVRPDDDDSDEEVRGDGDGDGVAHDDPARCNDPGLVWSSGAKTHYESYPEPGSRECIEFSGCKYEGLFAACEQKRSLEWVASHNIVAVFPDFGSLELHDICVRGPDGELIVATVLDTCGDHDCDGCCTDHKGDADQLIDLEVHTNDRFGAEDGRVEWADLGPTEGGGCAD